MRRRSTPVLVALLVCSLGLLAACGDNPDATPDTVTGVITDVVWNEAGTEVLSFTLDGPDGSSKIMIDDEVAYGFDLAHLEEHRATQDRVKVRLRDANGKLFAEQIEDA